MARVFVGMSGGVDSSVAASLLVDQGHEVTGVFMKNWTQDMPGMRCSWAEDVADAKRVAVQLGIDFEVFDFEDEYRQRVVDAMVVEYRAGRTPNPDVMCNQEIKFKLFLETALERGAEMVATGHYAVVGHDGEAHGNRSSMSDAVTSRRSNLSRPSLSSAELATLKQSSKSQDDSDKLHGLSKASSIPDTVPSSLFMAKDVDKDQTYFLYRVSGEALARTVFPLGGMTKQEVRDYARERGLWTAAKKESMGICFVGQVGIREFLEQYVDFEPGDIVERASGEVIGRHDGAILYTLGQRHGLSVGGGLPYYVVDKDMQKNVVYVSQDLNSDEMWRKELRVSDVHWINDPPSPGDVLHVRLRHRGALLAVEDIDFDEDGSAGLKLGQPERAVSPGQSAVIYRGDECLGGGIVSL